MEGLLKWSIENSSGSSGDKRAKLPAPELLKQLFGGKDEAAQMKDAVQVIQDPEADLEAKEIALDNLEMLVENLDNANNLASLGLWSPIVELLDSKEPVIRKYLCWIIGTAVQNNTPAQKHFLETPGSLVRLIKSLTDTSLEVAVKAIYALTSLLAHNENGYKQFCDLDGWKILSKLVDSSQDPQIRLRSVSLVSVISTSAPVEEKLNTLRQSNIIPSLIELVSVSENNAAVERTLRLFTNLLDEKFPFSQLEHERIVELTLQHQKSGLIENDSEVGFVADRT